MIDTYSDAFRIGKVSFKDYMDIGIVTLDGRVSPNQSVWFDMM